MAQTPAKHAAPAKLDSALPPENAEKLAAYEDAARGAYADNTRRATIADTNIYSAWCIEMGRNTLDPAALAAFIDAMAEVKAPATVRRYVASINHMFRAAGMVPLGGTEVVRLALKRMNRAKGTRQRQAEPLRREDVDRIIEAIEHVPGREQLGYRDAALLSLAYDTMARRSELAALNVSDLTKMEDGSGVILIARSKTDQEGEGRHVYVAPDTMVMLDGWIAVARVRGVMGQEDGPLFLPLGPAAKKDRLDAQDVTLIFKRRAKAAGIDPAQITGHSTRVGAAQDMRAAGITTGEIAQAGRWKSEAMVHRYTEKLGAKDGAAAKLASMQGRRS